LAGLSGDLLYFLTDLLLTFGAFSLLAGAFTAYFGSGKSRKIGLALIVLGLVVILLVYVMFQQRVGVDPMAGELRAIVYMALVHIIGALVGAALALVVFLVAIMKS